MRPKTLGQTPEQKQRDDRLKAAFFVRGTSRSAFVRESGFTSVSLWRWVRNGDPKSTPRNGGTPTTGRLIAKALNIDPRYLDPDGPDLVNEPEPFPAEAS